jgi:formylglycine-generating enzyme required for sulfatase activity
MEQPVVGISWSEAVAFCLWISSVTSEGIMLPTEDQWQYAAQGDDGRIYPWGNNWDCERCNNSVYRCYSNVTTSVTCYEGKDKGDSPFDVVDMVGNVCEWCLTDYDKKTNDVESNAEYHVMRGGFWGFDNAKLLRCDFRNAGIPDERINSVGFRLARLPG